MILFQENREMTVIEQLIGSPTFPRMASDQEMRDFFNKHSNTSIVVSERTGLGKSRFIQNKISHFRYKRILLSGDMTADKFFELHLDKMPTNQTCYHYDLHPCSEIGMLLFQALILKCVVAGDEKILHIPNETEFNIEIAHSLNSSLGNSIFNYIQKTQIQWSLSDLVVSSELQSNVQVLAHFIDRTDHKAVLDDFLQNLKTQRCTKEACISLLERYIKNSDQSNFYIVNSFINLAGNSLRRFYESPYFSSVDVLSDQFGRDDGKLFFHEVKNLIIQLSQEITMMGSSLENQERAMKLVPLEEVQMKRLEGLKWENSLNLLMIINDSGTILPIFKESKYLPRCLQTFYGRYSNFKSDLKLFENLSPKEVLERMSRIFGSSLEDLEKSMKARSIDISRISFTRDNFMKLAFIYLRLRVGQSVIIMGETGVGKTAIINYLADVLNYEFRVLNLHEGVTEDDILEFVSSARSFASSNRERKVLLFFDEINTNMHIDGLLKEIVIDRRVRGDQLQENILLAAACNPYQFKSYKENGVLEGISAGLKHQQFVNKQSKLVYTVRPLPESFFMFLWDYGSLSRDEESKIILKMISGVNQHENFKKDELKESDINNMASCVSFAQAFIREHEAKWAVSLRDVARFQKLFCYFYLHNSISYKGSSFWQWKPSSTLKKERAFTLAICFCYYFRIQSKELREKFKIELEKLSRRMSFSIDKEKLEKILKEEYQCFLDRIEIPPGIGKNTPLKENIFVIFTCLMNKVPLFLTGKPGSTKTIAMNLIMKSMKGKSSTNEFFKNLPAVMHISYQGSLQSTSAGIKRVFDKAIKYQQQQNQADNIVVVSIDEIGLAEISPNNPLKVLHSLLEPPLVAVVGISNWALDASKMNRGITMSRPDPDIRDLIESAESINSNINEKNEQKKSYISKHFISGLAQGYLDYLSSQNNHFHGLRDFYSLIQQVSSTVEPTSFSTISQQNQVAVLKAIERNFGGADTQKIVAVFGKALDLGELSRNFVPTASIELLKQNLQDRHSRHMMLIAKEDDEDEALQLVLDVLIEDNIEHKFFQGSDFRDDTTEDAAYRVINDIILCMERGISCVLVNQSIIYQSFYDMLNQNYQVVNGQSYCRVAIGADSTRCLVHHNFRCIVIVTERGAKNLDPPLLNRFEKQKFHRSDVLEGRGFLVACVTELKSWVTDMETHQGKSFTEQDLFPVGVKPNVKRLIAMIDHETGLQVDDDPTRQEYCKRTIIDHCKEKIVQMATFHGLFRVTQTHHIPSMLERVDLKRVIKSKLDNESFSKNLIVFTYQSTDIDILEQEMQVGYINLDYLNSKNQFIEKSKAAFKKNRLLIVYANSVSISIQRIKLCKNILAHMSKEDPKNRRVCFIIGLTDPKNQVEKHTCSFHPQWEEIFIEIINGQGKTGIFADKILTSQGIKSILQANDQVVAEIARDNIAGIFSKINYQMSEAALSSRIAKVKHALLDMTAMRVQLMTYFERLFEKYEEPAIDWKVMVSKNSLLMNSRVTFHGAAYEYLSRLVIKYFSFILFQMEHEGVAEVLLSSGASDVVMGCFDHFFLEQTIPMSKGTPEEKFAITYMAQYSFDIQGVFACTPFARHLHGLIMTLKPQFVESKEMDQLWERFQVSVQSHLNSLGLCEESFIASFMSSFPCLMQHESGISSFDGDFIMQFLKVTPGRITDLYAVYWEVEDLLKDLSIVMSHVVPLIFQKEELFELLLAGNLNMARASAEGICYLIKVAPAKEFFSSITQLVAWMEGATQSLAVMEDSDSLKRYLFSSNSYKELKLLLSIVKHLIIPFEMEKKYIVNVLEIFKRINIKQEPGLLILEVQSILQCDQEQEERSLQLMRFVCQYLEARLEETEDFQQVTNLGENAVECLRYNYSRRNLKDPRFHGIAHSLLMILIGRMLFFSQKVVSQEILSILDGLVQGKDCEDPAAILLTDVFEKSLYAGNRLIAEMDFDRAIRGLLVNQHESHVETIVSLAHFRHAAKVHVQQYSQWESTGVISEQVQMIKRVFNQHAQAGQRCQALIIYFVKLLKQRNMPLEMILKKGDGRKPLDLMPWLSRLTFIDEANYKTYQLQNLPDVTQQILNMLADSKTLLAYLERELSPPIAHKNSLQELAIRQALLQTLYMNKVERQGTLQVIRRVFISKTKLEADFFLSLCGDSRLNDQCSLGREMLAAPKVGFMPELLTFIAACCFSCNESSFMKKLLTSALSGDIRNAFLPFLPNTDKDFEYQSLFAAGDKIRRYRCVTCNTIFCVSDCGQLGHNRGEGSSMVCRGCGRRVGWDTKDQLVAIDGQSYNKQTFKVINEREAVKSYLRLDPDIYEQTSVRELHKAVKLIGSIFMHSVFTVGLLFSSREGQRQICALCQVRGTSDDAYRYLKSHIDKAWNQLLADYQLTNEQLLCVIENVGNMLTYNQNDSQLVFDLLQTQAGRAEFENNFQTKMIPNYPSCLNDNFALCVAVLNRQKSTTIKDPITTAIEENVDLTKAQNKADNFYSIFRNQASLNMQSFKLFIESPKKQEEAALVRVVIQSLQSFKHIHHLMPLLRWVQYSLKHFNRVVSYNTAYDRTIAQVIDEHLPRTERLRARQLADQFVRSWNQIQSDIREIGEACDTLQLQGLAVDTSKFLYCCMTNRSKDSLGFHLFLVLRYLASKQNEFLTNLQMEFKSVSLLEVKPEQILRLGGDDIEALIARLVQETSFVDIKYGNGRELHYDIERIKSKLQDRLITGLVMIKYDDEMTFEFGGVVNESNPFNEYCDIQTKVGRQERCDETPRLLELIQSNEDRVLLLSQMRLVMSFLQQTGGDPEKSLADYMRAFSIDKCLKQIQDLQSLRLKHVLDIFEWVEQSLHKDLVEKTHPKYRVPLTDDDKRVLSRIVEKLSESDLQFVRLALGSLCIRQLSASQELSEDLMLFPILFIEDNAYLFGISDDTIERQSNLLDRHFLVSAIKLGQAYHAYKYMSVVNDARAQEQLIQEERRRKQHEMNTQRIMQQQDAARQEMEGGVR